MKFVNNIISWFSKQKEEPVAHEDPEESEQSEESEPPPKRQLPDKIELPWPMVVKIYNYEELKKKTHQQIKDFLYEKAVEEKRLFDKIELIEERVGEETDKISKLFGIEDEREFDLYVPQSPGKSGSLVRAKPIESQPKNKDQQS